MQPSSSSSPSASPSCSARVAFLTLARRTDVRGAGALSAETVRRDASARTRTRQPSTSDRSGAEVEAAAAEARNSVGVGLAPVTGDTGLAPWTPPDPDAARRQPPPVLQPRHDLADGGRHRHVLGGQLRGLPVADQDRWLRRQGPRRSPRRHPGRHPHRQRLLLRARGSRLDHRVPGRRRPEGRRGLPREPDARYRSRASSPRYQKCPHLGCRVPQCVSSQWFECGCHGSQYNRVGEKKGGPAPRGMDHFPLEFSAAGEVTVDTGTIVQGAADRHQHHRPRGRGPALRRSLRPLMTACRTF